MRITLALALLLGSLTVQGNGSEEDLHQKKFEKDLQACMTENGVQKDDFLDLVPNENWTISNVRKPAKCAAHCYYVASELSNSKGNIVDKAAMKALNKNRSNKDELDKAVDECAKDRNSDPCDNAYQFFDCILPHFRNSTG
ncbi:uncharacterized protein LOC117591806 [Drosophila guanche]|uniref:Uncharacterized protein n=1 Tax=Drosophila guanche TaxID=7266 RepID=A0A3B0JPF8_DROGU|nr:uncharacterized protein LOC117591806 [Drosophila guanche]SPP75499.1 Hypothetical predicted protein [Drosophila guanche]